MNRKFSVTLLLALAAAAHAEDLKAVAAMNTAAQSKAILAKDVSWYEKTYAKDYYQVDRKGKKETRAQALAEFKQAMTVIDPKTAVAKVLKVTPSGGGMIVSLDVHLTGAIKEPNGGRAHPLDMKGRFEEKWVKVGGVWKLGYEKQLSQVMKVDGKVVSQ